MCGSLLVGASVALADVPPPPEANQVVPPSPEERKKYSQLLSQGRKLEAANKLPEAAKAFADCLVMIPDDATALSELGYVQYRAGDLAQAEKTTRKAVARASQPTLRAASLYNLGLILLDRSQDKVGAAAALEESLRLRPNKVVEAALAKLDTKAVGRARVGITPLAGPFFADDPSGKKLHAEQCWKSLADEMPDLEVKPSDAKERLKCSYEVKVKLPAGSPFLDVRLWKSTGDYNWPKLVDTLAIRTAKGWYVRHFDSIWSNRWVSGSTKLLTAEVRDLGSRKVLELRWQRSIDAWAWSDDRSVERGMEEGRLEQSTLLLLAGIGPSGTPSATAPIPIAIAAAYGEPRDRKPDVTATLDVTFTPQGNLTLTGPNTTPTKVPKKKYADLLPPLLPGSFPVEFP
jgi:tetratricopeptide (TPR) repeat protein